MCTFYGTEWSNEIRIFSNGHYIIIILLIISDKDDKINIIYVCVFDEIISLMHYFSNKNIVIYQS